MSSRSALGLTSVKPQGSYLIFLSLYVFYLFLLKKNVRLGVGGWGRDNVRRNT